jgi:hypothetical protein
MGNRPAQPGMARHGNGPARPDARRANKARRALRAVPQWHAGLASGPGTTLRAIFRVVPA